MRVIFWPFLKVIFFLTCLFKLVPIFLFLKEYLAYILIAKKWKTKIIYIKYCEVCGLFAFECWFSCLPVFLLERNINILSPSRARTICLFMPDTTSTYTHTLTHLPPLLIRFGSAALGRVYGERGARWRRGDVFCLSNDCFICGFGCSNFCQSSLNGATPLAVNFLFFFYFSGIEVPVRVLWPWVRLLWVIIFFLFLHPLRPASLW